MALVTRTEPILVEQDGEQVPYTADMLAADVTAAAGGVEVLRGPAGADGPQGPAGPRGETGATGPRGDTGATGPRGDTGATGATGPAGRDGRDGADGGDGLGGPSVAISTFQAGHGWTDRASVGDQADDRADFIVGSQSMASAPDGATPYDTTLTLGSPVDLSASLLGMRLRITGGALATLVVRVASGTIATDYAEAAIYTKDALETWLKDDGTWATTWVPRRLFTVTGTVDWSAIRTVQLVTTGAWFDAAALKLNWLGAIPEPSTGVVSIGFDDGYAGVLTYGLPPLSLAKLPASAFIIADAIGSSGTYMTEANLGTLQNEHGWEIGSHAATLTAHNAGFDGLSADAAEAEMRGIRAWLADRGLRGGDVFSWPLGQTGKETVARRLFRLSLSSRGSAGRRAELVQPFEHDRHHLRYWSVNGLTTTAADVKAAIDQAAADKTWLILCFHNLVSGTPAASTEFRSSDFADVVDYLARSGMPVRTVGDHARRLGIVSDAGPLRRVPVPVLIPGTLTTATVPLMVASVPAGQTVKLAALAHTIGSGTSASFRLQINGSDVTGYGTSGAPLVARTTAATADAADVTLRDGDRITAVISAVSGSPANGSFTLHLLTS